jgi:hypothetical protein
MRLEVALVPDPNGISMARDVVNDLSCRVLSDEDLGWRLGMATHELLDNARKYGSGRTADFLFYIEAAGAGHVANMKVRTRSNPEQIASLKETLAEIQGATDAWAFYLQAMQRTAAREEGSGLGLARIRAEGEMTLSASFDDDLVSICVELRVDGTNSMEGGTP